MSPVWRFVFTWAGVVLVFDLVASVVSTMGDVPYGWFALGSAVIYLAAGYVGAPRFGLSTATIAVVSVAAVDATLGWALSWIIGAGRMDEPDVSVGVLLVSGMLSALVFGAITGAAGGWIGLRARSRGG